MYVKLPFFAGEVVFSASAGEVMVNNIVATKLVEMSCLFIFIVSSLRAMLFYLLCENVCADLQNRLYRTYPT